MPRPPRPLAAVLLLACAAAGCREEPFDRRMERELLIRQRAALEEALSASADPGADPATGALVVLPGDFLERLISLALPVETTTGSLKVAVHGASVDLREGLALVRLDARVSWADREDVRADVEVVGVLQVVGVSESTGILTSRVEILGIETRRVRVGALAPPVERLLDELASRPVEELNRLLGNVEIPVRVASTLRIPRVAEGEVTIEGVDLPLRVGVHDVRAHADRLWIHLDVAVGGGDVASGAPAGTAPPAGGTVPAGEEG